jgi:hypothetical protein
MGDPSIMSAIEGLSARNAASTHERQSSGVSHDLLDNVPGTAAIASNRANLGSQRGCGGIEGRGVMCAATFQQGFLRANHRSELSFEMCAQVNQRERKLRRTIVNRF